MLEESSIIVVMSEQVSLLFELAEPEHLTFSSTNEKTSLNKASAVLLSTELVVDVLSVILSHDKKPNRHNEIKKISRDSGIKRLNIKQNKDF